MPHHHPVDLDGLGKERGNDVQELVVAPELIVARKGLVDRQRPGSAPFDLDRHAQEADHLVHRLGGQAVGPVEEVRLGPHVLDDSRPAGRHNVARNPLAQGIFSPIDLLRRKPNGGLRAEPASRFVQQHKRPPVHGKLLRNDVHYFLKCVAQLQCT